MVAPVTGPVYRSKANGLEGVGSYDIRRVCYRQAKPYNLALPYTYERYVTTSCIKNPDWFWSVMANANVVTGWKVGPYFFGSTDQMAKARAQAINLAVEKYRSKRSESAELLTTLVQREQAMSMISTRALQLRSLALAVASKDHRKIRRAMRTLGRNLPSPGWRVRSKHFARTWLELSYGWIPLVKDLGASVALLEKPISSVTQKVRGKTVDFQETDWYGSASSGSESRYSGNVSVQVGSRLYIDNPNLYLASQLGFTNPAAVAWELVPYSFIVDWFIPVQGFLQNFNSSHGLTEGESYHTIVWRGQSGFTAWKLSQDDTRFHRSALSGIVMSRITGIPGISLTLRPPWRLSFWKAANAVSLLVGFLKYKA